MIHFKLFIIMNLSEPFHVTNGVSQGGVLSLLFFSVHLDDLSLEQNSIEAGFYIGKVLLNRLMFADDNCALSMSQVYMGCKCKVCLMCVRLMQNRMELFSTAAKLFE